MGGEMKSSEQYGSTWIILIFADDMVLFSHTQTHINCNENSYTQYIKDTGDQD